MQRELQYIIDLSRKNFEAIGFIPKPRLEEYVRRGQVLTTSENDEPCGFLVFGNGWPILKVYQCCIQYDARRIHHGFSLVDKLITIAEGRACSAISLWCADDLESNRFWGSIGFSFAGQRDIGNQRGRKHNQWVLYLEKSRQMSLFPFNKTLMQRKGRAA